MKNFPDVLLANTTVDLAAFNRAGRDNFSKCNIRRSKGGSSEGAEEVVNPVWLRLEGQYFQFLLNHQRVNPAKPANIYASQPA